MTDQSTARTWTWPWETATGTFFLLSYMAIVTIGCLLPLDVLERYPQAKEFSDFMSSWNIQVYRVGEISGPANQVNRLTYSILWCVMPVYWVLAGVSLYQNNKKNNFVMREKSWFKFWLVNFGVVFMIYIIMTLNGDRNSTIGKLMFVYQFSRSLFAPGMVFVAGFFAMGIAYSVWGFFAGKVIFSEEKNG